jgi:hypothetical protein
MGWGSDAGDDLLDPNGRNYAEGVGLVSFLKSRAPRHDTTGTLCCFIWQTNRNVHFPVRFRCSSSSIRATMRVATRSSG